MPPPLVFPGDGHPEGRWGEQSVRAGGKGSLLPAHVWTQHRLPRSSSDDPADGVHEVSQGRDVHYVTTTLRDQIRIDRFSLFFFFFIKDKKTKCTEYVCM